MISEPEAAALVQAELGRDSELLGAELALGVAMQTPNFWVFTPNRADGQGSLSYAIPPIVVDRRDGRVTRPIAAGQRILARDLGPDEWFVLAQPTVPREHDAYVDMPLGPEDLAAIAALRHFRVRRPQRDAAVGLEAGLVATSPSDAETGLSAAGIGHDVARTNPENASVRLFLSGSAGGDPWTFGHADIVRAREIEAALDGAAWVRFWY